MKISFKLLLVIVLLTGWVCELPAQTSSCKGSKCKTSGLPAALPMNAAVMGMGGV